MTFKNDQKHAKKSGLQNENNYKNVQLSEKNTKIPSKKEKSSKSFPKIQASPSKSSIESKCVSKQKKSEEVTNEAKRRINEISRLKVSTNNDKNSKSKTSNIPDKSSKSQRSPQKKSPLPEYKDRGKFEKDKKAVKTSIPTKKDRIGENKTPAEKPNNRQICENTYTPVEMPMRPDWFDLPKERHQ